MAQEQTAYAGDDIKILVNVIAPSGSHAAAVINTTTTRLDGLSAAPTVSTITTGIYEINFSGVTPAPAEGDRYTCKVNGTIAGVAWSEYGIPVKIVADERGTNNVAVPTADITAIKAKTDQLAFTVSNQVDANALTGGGGDDSATIYNYFTASSREDAFKATGFNTVAPDNASITDILADTADLQANQGDWVTATGFNTVAPDNASIASILADTNELQTNQGDWATATGFATVNPDNTSIAAILVDTADLQANQGQWLTATGFSTFDASTDTVTTDTASRDASKADVSSLATAASIAGLNDFNPTTDTVANVTLVATTTTNTDMRGTDGANTVAPNTTAPDNASITAIKAKTDQLAFTVSNQVDANALTGGGGDDSATIYNYFTASSREDAFKATGFNTVTPDNVSISAILADTNELQTNQGDWATATGFATVNPDNTSIAAILVDTADLQANQGDWATATGFATVNPDNTSIANILADTNELQQNQGDWATATGFNTVAPDNASITAILADTNELQTNQGDWATATGFSTFDPSSDVVVTDTASRNASKADVSGLSTFDHTSDQVVASNMRGTDGANTVAPVDVSADVTAILADTNELQQNQGDWLTATGFNTVAPDNASIASILADTNELQSNQGDWATATGFNTVAPDNASIALILADTNELQGNQGDWATATGFNTVAPDNAGITANGTAIAALNDFDPASDTVANVTLVATTTANTDMRGTDGANTVTPNTVAPDNAGITANGNAIAALNDFDPASDTVANVTTVATNTDMRGTDGANTVTPVDVSADVTAILADTNELQQNQGNWLTATTTVSSNMRGTDNALLAASAPSNWSTLIVGTGADAGKVTTSNPATGAGSSHTAQDVANLILVTPANKLATDASGDVEANNMRGTDGANTVAPVDVSADVTAILADTNELQGNQGDWATATGFNTVAPDNASITAILADTNELQSNQGDWLTATGFSTFDASSDVVVTDSASRNASKADVIGLSTFDPASDQVVASNMRGTDNALLAASVPTNWSVMAINGSGEITTSNPASGSGSAHTAQDVANLILVTPANKLATDASGNVEANNMRGTDGANTVAPVDVSSDVALILADTNELQGNQGDWATATTVVASNMRGTDGANTVAPVDVSADVAAILTDTNELQGNQSDWATATGFNTVAPDNASITAILADTNELQSNQGDWATATGFSTFNSATEEVTTDTASRNASKADVSGLATQVSVDVIDGIVDNILLDTNELQANQGDWATATGFATVNPDNASIAAIKTKTDQFVFTVSNQVDANSLTGGLSEAQVRDAVGLASANLDTQLNNIPTSSEIATEILAAGDIDGYSLEETLKLCLAALAGKISGAGTGTITIRSADDTSDRIIATTDNRGNRLSITIDEAG